MTTVVDSCIYAALWKQQQTLVFCALLSSPERAIFSAVFVLFLVRLFTAIVKRVLAANKLNKARFLLCRHGYGMPQVSPGSFLQSSKRQRHFA